KYIVCEPLERAGFKNAFSTRLGGTSELSNSAGEIVSGQLSLGNLSQDTRERVMENRRRFLSAINASDWTLVTARQIHSADVRVLNDEKDALSEPTSCDALTSNLPRILLAIQTADCLPVLIVDERTRSFAAIHAGWRGTLAGIVARTVERMQQQYDSRPADLLAAIGPGISAKNFEVGPEVLDAFREAYAYGNELFSTLQPSGKGYIDLNLANVRQLIDAGLNANRIYDSGLCTIDREDLFFSYRRERGHERPVGRLMSVVGREE
ncbi:MAG TPA: peptidoglycan editing factor PgeF, partial [Blastocatellia bacterium]|nr:peptidoglycan editing factor PgeF [Blastocatellia bacterium]